MTTPTTIVLRSNYGVPSTQGAAGKSAYQVAVANGFVGTEAEWLATLVGPQGPTGAPGPSGSVTLSAIADEAIGALKVVRSSAPGHVVLARWPEVTSVAPLGVAVAAAAPGDTVQVQGSGEIYDASWSWTPGAPVFLTSLGTLTQVVPTSDYLLTIGEAVAATRLVVRIQTPIYLAP